MDAENSEGATAAGDRVRDVVQHIEHLAARNTALEAECRQVKAELAEVDEQKRQLQKDNTRLKTIVERCTQCRADTDIQQQQKMIKAAAEKDDVDEEEDDDEKEEQEEMKEENDVEEEEEEVVAKRYLASAEEEAAADQNQLLLSLEEQKQRYRCSYCKYASDNRHAVISHERTHTGERPYKCHFCGNQYGRSSVLREHLKTVHNNWRVHKYWCYTCGDFSSDSQAEVAAHGKMCR